MVGRVMPHVGLGPWWQYIKTFHDYEAAASFALQLAADDHSLAWVFRCDQYEPIDSTHKPRL